MDGPEGEATRTEVRSPVEGAARVLLFSGLGMFLVMQGLPLTEQRLNHGEWETSWGYELWKELLEAAGHADSLEVSDFISISGYLLSIACVLVAPFCVKLLRSSRLWWWLFTGCMAIAALSFTLLVGQSMIENYGVDYDSRVRVGAIAFLVFPYLTLAGLLCLRGKVRRQLSEGPT